MRAVKQAHGTPFTSSGYFVALMLVLFSASGLLAGVLTKEAARALRPSAGNTSTLAPVDRTATANAATPTATDAFTLQVTVTPTLGKAGQTIQVAVAAAGKGTTTPMSGVICSLVQTADSLVLAPWPDPVTTDSAGHAQWNISVPQMTTPDQYTIAVRGEGPSGYRYTRYAALTISA